MIKFEMELHPDVYIRTWHWLISTPISMSVENNCFLRIAQYSALDLHYKAFSFTDLIREYAVALSDKC